jgi:hypothetical protein
MLRHALRFILAFNSLERLKRAMGLRLVRTLVEDVTVEEMRLTGFA